MVATTPVLATGHRYPTPSSSSSRLMTALVANSSYASSGFSWISLLILFIQFTVNGSLATPVMWSLTEEFQYGVNEFREGCRLKQEQKGLAMEIRKTMRKGRGTSMAESLKMDWWIRNSKVIFLYTRHKGYVKYNNTCIILQYRQPGPYLSHVPNFIYSPLFWIIGVEGRILKGRNHTIARVYLYHSLSQRGSHRIDRHAMLKWRRLGNCSTTTPHGAEQQEGFSFYGGEGEKPERVNGGWIGGPQKGTEMSTCWKNGVWMRCGGDSSTHVSASLWLERILPWTEYPWVLLLL